MLYIFRPHFFYLLGILHNQEILKPTRSGARGFGRGLTSMLEESWNSKHALAAPSQGNLSAHEPFKITKCAKLKFCHCSGSGEQAFYLHCKMVALLRPYLFNRKERKKKGETDAEKKTVKTPKSYPIARRVLNQAFLILKLEPRKPENCDDFFGVSSSTLPAESVVLSGWGALANQAWAPKSS